MAMQPEISSLDGHFSGSHTPSRRPDPPQLTKPEARKGRLSLYLSPSTKQPTVICPPRCRQYRLEDFFELALPIWGASVTKKADQHPECQPGDPAMLLWNATSDLMHLKDSFDAIPSD
jgi:hypothetical protein